MAPFVAILSLISICKRDNCPHMEAMDGRGQRNFFHQAERKRRGGVGVRRGSPSAVIPLTGIGRNRNWGSSTGGGISLRAGSFIPSPVSNRPTPPLDPTALTTSAEARSGATSSLLLDARLWRSGVQCGVVEQKHAISAEVQPPGVSSFAPAVFCAVAVGLHMF